MDDLSRCCVSVDCDDEVRGREFGVLPTRGVKAEFMTLVVASTTTML